MIVVLGEILTDRFVDYERIGGAPFNFAFHLKQMGWPVRFITRVGDDARGRGISRMLVKNGFVATDIQIDPHHRTGLVDVSLDRDGIPQFDIREDAAYDHIDLPPMAVEDKAGIELFYFGSLIQRTANGRKQVCRLLDDKPAGAKCFCDINLRLPHVHEEAIHACLRLADILKLNADELKAVGSRRGGPLTAEQAVAWLMRNYGIDTVALTLGSQGSRVFTGQEDFTAPPAAVAGIVDTVGAGDAYAAVLAAGILRSWPMHRTLALATRFAADICALPGAVPEESDIYAPLRAKN